MSQTDAHLKVQPLLGYKFHYGICLECGNEIILSENPPRARIKKKCNRCKYIKNRSYQQNYVRKKPESSISNCKYCRKEITRTNEFRLSNGEGSHFYFCSLACKSNYRSMSSCG